MRIFWIKLIFFTFFLSIVSRLFYWQIIKADQLQAQAENQHIKREEISALRGNIYYSDGSMLASSNPSFLLYGLPKVIKLAEKKDLSYALAKILLDGSPNQNQIDETSKDILDKLSEDLYWIALSKNVDTLKKKKIAELNNAGLGFEQKAARFYPEGSQSAQLLGFVGSDAAGLDVGYFGIEGFYEGELKAIEGSIEREKDALGLPILTGDFFQTRAKNGKDLILNIDRTVQFMVENALKKGLEKYGAQASLAIIMNPQDGSIKAMASFPNYDPARYFEYPKEHYKNPAVAFTFEPGSIFKVMIMAAALNEDSIEVDTECDVCDGPISLGGFSIRTWNNKYYPKSKMVDVIVHSDNIGMVFVGKKLGLDRLYSYLEKFGLGKLTNIDLQEEVPAQLRPKEQWREIDLATASFGQGIAVTPIQMVTAVAALANGGKLMEPQVVKSIIDQDGVFEIKPKIVTEVIKESSAKIITEMMVKAVSEGEAKWAKPKGFKIAGKTGTAQIPIAGHYDPDKTIASFVGFAPADDPKFVMLVLYDQPTTSIYGSETAAPTFFEIAKELFTYYKIAPSE